MIEIKKTYSNNGHERTYTVISAQRSGGSVILQTQESGAVVISENDDPDMYDQLVASGIDIAPEPPQEEDLPLPTVEEKLDADLRARQKQKLQVGQARAALVSGDIAGAIAALTEAIEPTAEQNSLDAKIMAAKTPEIKS